MLSGWWTSSRVLTGLSSPSTKTVSDVTIVGSSRSSTIFQTRPFVERGVPACGHRPSPARVDDVDDVLHAGPLVVGDVLDPDELEHVVEVAPVLEHPLWAVDAGPGSARPEIELPAAVRRRQRKPTSAAFNSEPSGFMPGGDVLRHLDEVARDDGVGPGRSRSSRCTPAYRRRTPRGRPRRRAASPCPVRCTSRAVTAPASSQNVSSGDGQRPARERRRPRGRPARTRGRDAVLVVVPPHAVDRVVLAGLDVERDDEAAPLVRAGRDRRWPRGLPEEDVVGRLLVREEDRPVEPSLLVAR